jgi:hypothetical protein
MNILYYGKFHGPWSTVQLRNGRSRSTRRDKRKLHFVIAAPLKMSTPTESPPMGEGSDKAGLDFYFGRPTEMMRKLETSKPVRRTRADKKTGPAEGAANGEASDAQGAYLFKWQKDVDDEGEEEEEEVTDLATRARGRWQTLTGNVPSSQLSVGAYFEKDGPKGKPLREGLVNAGGVIMLQPGTAQKGGGKLNLGELSMLNETGKGAFFHDDNVLSLRSKEEIIQNDLERNTEERLVFRRHIQWPPEAPGFPPPPPDANETVQYKRMPINNNAQQVAVRRMSRIRPNEGKPPSRTLGSMHEAALEAGVPSQRALDLASMGTSFRGDGSMSRTRAASSLTNNSGPAPSTKSSASAASTAKPGDKKGGFLRRISFLPGMGGKKEGSSAFPGIYASLVVVPYMLPPPPQPPKHPPPGSNEERRQQKLAIKRMFLEDQYSQAVELSLEKIRLNEMCRDLESQITDADNQINMLIGANDQ